MKKGISVGIGVCIFVIILVIVLISSPKSDVVDPKNITDSQGVDAEIKTKLDAIEKNKLRNDTSWKPKAPKWQTSGPFQIDDNEYALGQKIFLIIGGINVDEKGQVVFMRPLNATHYSVYLSVSFDGAKKSQFNYYLEPKLSKIKGLCSTDDLVGKWAVVFRGTEYPNLDFKITKDMVPGTDVTPVC